MYIELSARHSGKTKRLIEAIEAHLLENWQNIAIIVSQNISDSERLKRAVSRGINYGSRIRCIFDMTAAPLDRDEREKAKFFVQDFDFISERNLLIVENAYYVTTLARQRKPGERDFLTRLLVANDGKYSSYAFGGDYCYLRDLIGKKAFDAQTQLGWLSPNHSGKNREYLEKVFEAVRKQGEISPSEISPFHKSFENFLIERLATALDETGLYLAAEV